MQSLASVDQLAAYVGEEIAADNERAPAVLRMASSFVRSLVADSTFEGDEAPAAVVDVVIDVASRVWTNPEGLVADGVDDYRRQWSQQASDRFYLTAANKAMLAPFKASSGLRVLSTTRLGRPVDDTIYYPTAPPPSGYPFPWEAV